jgi:DNA-binding LytR/AlgR family response regulator
MTYKCLIVDDEAPARKLLSEYVHKIPILECLHVVSNARQAESLLKETAVDILFLDIQMPDLTGLDLIKLLPNPKPAIILTTAYSQYAVESYEFAVADYLLKPIVFERFAQAVDKVIGNFLDKVNTNLPIAQTKETEKTSFPDATFVKSNLKIVKIYFDQILYIEGLREYISIFTTEGRHVVLQSLSRFLEILPPTQFIRVHRSYIVNVERIDAVENNTIRVGNTEIVISKSQKLAFMNFINRDLLF